MSKMNMSVSAEFGKVVAGFAALQDEQWLTFNAMISAIQENRAQDAAFYAMEFGLNSPDAAKQLFDYLDQRFLSQDIRELFEMVHGGSETLKVATLSRADYRQEDELRPVVFADGRTMPMNWFDLHRVP